jgi:hypothetical protein
MAKTASKSPNKADHIRALLKENPRMKTKEVVQTLASKGVKVSANHVYILKSKAKHRKHKRQKDEAVAAGGKAGIPNPVQAVTKVKNLARELGGLGTLRQLVTLLSE